MRGQILQEEVPQPAKSHACFLSLDTMKHDDGEGLILETYDILRVSGATVSSFPAHLERACYAFPVVNVVLELGGSLGWCVVNRREVSCTAVIIVQVGVRWGLEKGEEESRKPRGLSYSAYGHTGWELVYLYLTVGESLSNRFDVAREAMASDFQLNAGSIAFTDNFDRSSVMLGYCVVLAKILNR